MGCSFTDERMNDLLREAAARIPGRRHYAALQWKGTPDPGADGIERASARYLEMGVQPLWVRRHDDVPDIVRCLA